VKEIGKLLAALDEILAPENKIHSTVKQVSRYYDPKSAEYVCTLEYKVKVAPANRPSRAGRAGSLLGAILEPGDGGHGDATSLGTDAVGLPDFGASTSPSSVG
jgi:hypothetical protein